MSSDTEHDYNTMDGLIDSIYDDGYTKAKACHILKQYLNDFDAQETINALENVLKNIDKYNEETLEVRLKYIRDEIAPCACEDCCKENPISKRVYGYRWGLVDHVEELIHIRYMDLTTLLRLIKDNATLEDIKNEVGLHCNECGLKIKHFEKHICNSHDYALESGYINKFRCGKGVNVYQKGDKWYVER